MYLQLMIINKSGGLVYNQDLSPQAAQLDSNDWLRIGSTFHSLHEISRSIQPGRSSGIVALETSSFALRCLETMTGIKFVLTAERGTQVLEPVLRMVYELYTDYVLKNPFHDLEMPIRCRLFTEHVTELFESFHTTGTNANARHQFFTRLR